MNLADTKPKPAPTSVGLDELVGPIGFSNEIAKIDENIAMTEHLGVDVAELMPAQLALIKPSNDASGVVLGLKLRMSPRDHVGPTKLRVPLVVLPEGASIFDPRNARWTTIEVDLGFVYESEIQNVPA